LSLAPSPSSAPEKYLVVRDLADVERHLDLIRMSAARAQAWVTSHRGDPLDLLRQMKFHPVGFHPIEDRPLNLVEQLNQTWTYAVALEAARKLLELHPEAGGFNVAPGAHMSIPLDIMSIEPGLVGAETFAVTKPGSNNKLNKDLLKLAARPELNRYIFFTAPGFEETARIPRYERAGIQVWSVVV
jgi:hypothetical protein